MLWEAFYTLCLASFLYVAVKYIISLTQLKKYPPGPIPLPLIGNLHLIGTKPYESFKKLARTYGDVMSFSFGSQRIVVINGIHSAREALIQKGEEFAGRPQDIYLAEIYSRGYQNIGFSDYGPAWKLMRKITHSSMKMYGANMEQLEKNVLQEAKELFKRVEEKDGASFDPKYEISLAVLNVICSIVFGSRYDINDSEFRDVVTYIKLVVQGFDNAAIVSFLPWLRFFPNKGLSMLNKGLRMREVILHKKLKEHRDTFNPDNIRDFTDSLLNEFSKEASEDNKIRKYLTDVNFEQIVSDMFLSGAETTSTTILWCMALLVKYPEVQKKVEKERKERIGNRIPNSKDRGNLPYLEAMIQETLRISSITPLGAPHKAMCDTSVSGHNVPAGTQVLINHWAFHYDEREWDQPEVFKPERFLDENGNFIHGLKKSYLPFGAGRRVCIGEALGKLELFLFLSNILYRYEILPAPGEAIPDLEGVLGAVLSVKPYKIQMKRRPDTVEINI